MPDRTSSPPEIELLRRAYEAFNRRDFESVLNRMRADVDWPNGMEGGRVSGKDAVREYWKRQFQSLDSTVEPQAFTTESDGRIAVTVHQVVHDKAGELAVDHLIEHIYTIRDGLIASMEIRNPKD